MKKFIKNNEDFKCIHCKSFNKKHETSSRDHCTSCLYSIHVDINPGDRQNFCKGLMEPIGLQTKNRKIQIVYRCRKCNLIHKNIIANDDSSDEIIRLSAKIY